MTTPRDPALRQLVQKVLAERSRPAAGGEALAAAAQEAYDALVRVFSPLIGHAGVDALTARALHLARQEHPWLGDARRPGHADEPFGRMAIRLARQDPAVASDGAAAVLATLAGLLVTFLGESLTTGLLRKAWPEAFADAHTEEI